MQRMTATRTPCRRPVGRVRIRTRSNMRARPASNQRRRTARRTSLPAATACPPFTAKCVLCCTAPCLWWPLIMFHPQISSIQDEIRTYNDNVTRISDLHNRSLNNTDDAAAQRYTQQLEDLVADTSALSNVIKRRIKALERQPGSGRDGQIRRQQVCGMCIEMCGLRLTSNVHRLLWSSRSSSRPSRTIKQLSSSTGRNTSNEWNVNSKSVSPEVCVYLGACEQIPSPVKPDATPEEIKAVVDDDQGGQIFSQAVSICCATARLTHNLLVLIAHEL